MQRLVAYRWPGNIRELENVLERAVILATGPTLDFEIDVDLAVRPPSRRTGRSSHRSHPSKRSRAAISLPSSGRRNWVIEGPRGAAQILGLHPNTLRSRLKKLGIARSTHEPS